MFKTYRNKRLSCVCWSLWHCARACWLSPSVLCSWHFIHFFGFCLILLCAAQACSAGALNMAISTATVRDFVAKFVPQVEAGLQGLAISDVEVDKGVFLV